MYNINKIALVLVGRRARDMRNDVGSMTQDGRISVIVIKMCTMKCQLECGKRSGYQDEYRGWWRWK